MHNDTGSRAKNTSKTRPRTKGTALKKVLWLTVVYVEIHDRHTVNAGVTVYTPCVRSSDGLLKGENQGEKIVRGHNASLMPLEQGASFFDVRYQHFFSLILLPALVSRYLRLLHFLPKLTVRDLTQSGQHQSAHCSYSRTRDSVRYFNKRGKGGG